MAASIERFLPWWGRRIRPSMKQLVLLIEEAGGSIAREELRGRVHGGIVPPALRRGLVAEVGGALRLTDRGRAVAAGDVSEIPEGRRAICECGLVFDREDKAQMEYMRRHQVGDPETRACPMAPKSREGRP